MKKHYEKACKYVFDNIDHEQLAYTDYQIYKNHGSLMSDDPFNLSARINDLMEEYGDDNDLLEGWWLEFGDEEDVFAECMTLYSKTYSIL